MQYCKRSLVLLLSSRTIEFKADFIVRVFERTTSSSLKIPSIYSGIYYINGMPFKSTPE